jgi:hypothetical protein
MLVVSQPISGMRRGRCAPFDQESWSLMPPPTAAKKGASSWDCSRRAGKVTKLGLPNGSHPPYPLCNAWNGHSNNVCGEACTGYELLRTEKRILPRLPRGPRWTLRMANRRYSNRLWESQAHPWAASTREVASQIVAACARVSLLGGGGQAQDKGQTPNRATRSRASINTRVMRRPPAGYGCRA